MLDIPYEHNPGKAWLEAISEPELCIYTKNM